MTVTDGFPDALAEIPAADADRIRALPCWNGALDIAPLKGGLSNASYVVTDRAGRHVVRLGQDFPFHHVARDRELMSARAAYAAGFGPAVHYGAPGVMVTAFLGAATYTPEDVVANAPRIARLLGAFHQTMPREVSGPGFFFWAFHVVRDYARTLEAGGSPYRAELPRFLALAERLEAAQVPLPIVFGHNDLLPANILDDGERLWLIDFEYAGFSTAMFDLAGTSSNAGMPPGTVPGFLAAYFGHAPDRALLRAHAAMECGSLLRETMWSMVSELHLSAPGADYAAYTADNLTRLDAAVETYRTTWERSPS